VPVKDAPECVLDNPTPRLVARTYIRHLGVRLPLGLNSGYELWAYATLLPRVEGAFPACGMIGM
jgi:hypothetical protein